MINNTDWLKPKEKPYFHQTKLSSAHVSLDCIEKLAVCIEQFNKSEIEADTYVELSFQADLHFNQKLIQFRSVHFIIRQIIQKI